MFTCVGLMLYTSGFTVLLGVSDLLLLPGDLFGLAADLSILLVQLPPQPFDLTF